MKFRIQNSFRMEGNLRSGENRGDKEGEAVKTCSLSLHQNKKRMIFKLLKKKKINPFSE